MECKFNWHKLTSENDREIIENAINNIFSNPPPHLKPCHDLPVSIRLFKPHNADNIIHGEIKCDCGTNIGIIGCTLDGKELSIAAIQITKDTE